MSRQENNTEDSQIIHSDGVGIHLNVGGLMSENFSCIATLHESATAPFRLSTAVRYGKRYILKSIADKYADDPIHQALLAKEFEIGINIDHPNIRQTLGFEYIEGLGNAIVLEYIDGETLENSIAHDRLDKSASRVVLRQTAEALDYLHRKQILHRDIKPANIMLTYSGSRVKLIDFSHSDSDSFVMLKNPAGTSPYIAPELYDGKTKPSVKTDMYSFGMIAMRLADKYKDRFLRNCAARCCNPDPDKRPETFLRVFDAGSHSGFSEVAMGLLRSKRLTYTLIIMLISIWIYILS